MSINVEKQIRYWKNGAEEDIGTARILLEKDKNKEALFYAHLSLEKALKALVAKATQNIPPYIHNLTLLAEHLKLTIPENILTFLADMNQYAIIGRYPDIEKRGFSKEFVNETVLQTEEALKWLISQL